MTTLKDLDGGWSASIRIQLSAEFDLDQVRAIVPLLGRIGFRWLYLSPVWKAVPGSTHFYDVIDSNTVSPVLGGEDKFLHLAATAKLHGMNIILDFVPNHMAAHEDNKLWTEQRERYFDIEPATGVYRRFWDFGSMAALAMDKLLVYETIHEKLMHLYSKGYIQGVRIDHPEGLSNMYGYCRWLRESFDELPTIYIEKAHRPGRNIPAGINTVGMEWWWDMERLLGSTSGRRRLVRFWKKETGIEKNFDEIAGATIRDAAAHNFRQDAERLHRMLGDPSVSVDDMVFALGSFRDRIYPDFARRTVPLRDRKAIEAAHMHPAIARALLMRDEPRHDDFVAEFASLLVGVCGRGEHIARFRYMPLPQRCEHGFEPSSVGLSVEKFHANNLKRLQRFRYGMLAGSTHDGYRSFDARCMLDALSLFAGEWEEMVASFREINQCLRVGDAQSLALTDELSIYQALLSCPGISADRLTAYIIKAAREGWVTANWFGDDKEFDAPGSYHRWGITRMSRYERGIEEFIKGLFDQEHGFMSKFSAFAQRVAPVGRMFSLATLVLRLTSPGMADVYNGEDLWYYRLLDPDNRDLHDWDLRQRIIDGFERGAKPTLETVKLWILWKVLKLRLDRQGSFMDDGSYTPLCTGDDDVVAYQRGNDVQVWVSLNPRRTFQGPGHGWTNILADGQSVAGLPGQLFAAVYVRQA